LTPRIVFVSREVYPFGGGGLGASVTALANALSDVAEVSIVTTDLHEERFHELRASGSADLPGRVRFTFAREPRATEIGSFYNAFHLWSARAYEAVKGLYSDGGPEIVEFPDFLGEGAVTVQACKTRDPALRNTVVFVRNYTSREMCDVLNGYVAPDLAQRMVYELERYSLRYADHVIWPGGDVLSAYRRFYGEERVAAPELIQHVVERQCSPENNLEFPADPRLMLIYIGRLERRKGVQNLIRAVTSLDRDDWHLTLLGGDTNTAPLAVSMRAQLELMVAGDPRISFHPPVSRTKMLELLGKHHVAVYPSLWECWPFVALHAFDSNRPVIATPTGGFVEMVTPECGWLARDTTASALAETLERVLDSRETIQALVKDQQPRRALDRLTNTERVRDRYLELAESRPKRRTVRSATRARPLVSVIVPYFCMDTFIEATLESIFEQTYAPLETLVINDGSLRKQDWKLGELASRYPITVLTQQNSGLGAARNFGISQSRGRYVFPLDADNVATPTFVERCVDVLEHDPEIAYVNSWVRFVDDNGEPHAPPVEGYQPLGNDADALKSLNVAGDAAAVIRRRVFDLGYWYSADATSYEDWLFYRRLERNGLIGHSVPERLGLYRVRKGSMIREVGIPHHERLLGELEAHLREEEVVWTLPSV
jgi:glycosyltransferase involved in cell wall biosynthesis